MDRQSDRPVVDRVAVRAGFAPEGVERGKLRYGDVRYGDVRYGDVRYDVERHARQADDVVNFR